MDLNAFPDVVLRAVFDRVPLLDLFVHIPLVCHRWHSLQPSVLSGKKAIALTVLFGPVDQFVGGDREHDLSILCSNQLTNDDGSRMYPSPADDPRCSLSFAWSIEHFTPARVDAIIEQFDANNVIYLDMYFNKPEYVPTTNAISLLIRLLDHWTGCLKTLKLYGLGTNENDNDNRKISSGALMAQLIETVNALPLLEHLTLDLDEDLKMVKPLDLPILGRFKEFYFHSGCGKSDHLFDSLERYAEPNGQLRAIGLGNVGLMEEYLDKFSDSFLAKRFTILSEVGAPILRSGIIDIPVRERFLATFTSLTKLAIGMRHLNLAQLTGILSPLRSLVQLYLFSAEPFSKFDTDPVDGIRPLSSVKVLSLFADTRTHNHFASPHWARMFPQVQILMLVNHSVECSICKVADKEEFDYDRIVQDVGKEALLNFCVDQTLLPFKHFCALQKMYYYRIDIVKRSNCFMKTFGC